MFKQLGFLRDVVTVLLSLQIVVFLVRAWNGWVEFNFYGQAEAGFFTTQEEALAVAQPIDSLSVLLLWTSIAAFLLIVLFFCLWTFRAGSNAKLLLDMPQRMSPGWMVGWYFVPFANLWKPFQGVRELWRRSAWPPALHAPVRLNVWWVLWIGISYLSGVGNRVYASSEDIAVLKGAAAFMAVLDVLWVIPTLLLIWIVRQVSAMQAAKFAAVSAPDDDAALRGLEPDPRPSASAV